MGGKSGEEAQDGGLNANWVTEASLSRCVAQASWPKCQRHSRELSKEDANKCRGEPLIAAWRVCKSKLLVTTEESAKKIVAVNPSVPVVCLQFVERPVQVAAISGPEAFTLFEQSLARNLGFWRKRIKPISKILAMDSRRTVAFWKWILPQEAAPVSREALGPWPLLC